MDVKCQDITGEDGALSWAPQEDSATVLFGPLCLALRVSLTCLPFLCEHPTA